LEPLALYPANSLFLEGYLNAKGRQTSQTLRMIKDAGFIIKSDFDLDQILNNEPDSVATDLSAVSSDLKDFAQLKPLIAKSPR